MELTIKTIDLISIRIALSYGSSEEQCKNLSEVVGSGLCEIVGTG